MISMNCRLLLRLHWALGITWVSPGVNWGTDLQPFRGSLTSGLNACGCMQSGSAPRVRGSQVQILPLRPKTNLSFQIFVGGHRQLCSGYVAVECSSKRLVPASPSFDLRRAALDPLTRGDRAKRKPRPGKTGVLRTESGASGVRGMPSIQSR